MKTEEFNEIVEYVKENLITKTLIRKGEEYARGGDRLSNFKRMAAALGCTPEAALVGTWMKHIVSILDMVDDIEESEKNGCLVFFNSIETKLLWDEKIGDAINYLILLRGLVKERSNNKLPEGM